MFELLLGQLIVLNRLIIVGVLRLEAALVFRDLAIAFVFDEVLIPAVNLLLANVPLSVIDRVTGVA